MLLRFVCLAVLLVSWSAGPAAAHFIWAELAESPGGERQVRLYFGETDTAGDQHLIGKIAHAKVWTLSRDGVAMPLALEAKAEGDTAALVGVCATASPLGIEAVCDYGVYKRAPGGIHLLYYAKHLAADWPSQKPELLTDSKLKLDILPSLVGDKLELLVRFDGQADADREVVVFDPKGAEQIMKTDARGLVSIAAEPGRYAIRAGHVDPKLSGSLDGASYGQTAYYATLTLRVPEANSVAAHGETAGANAASSSAAPLTAEEMLRQARLARAVWKDFPGLTADVTVRMSGLEASGKLTLDADGNAAVEMPAGPAHDWVESQMASLARHRMPDGEVGTGDVRFADNDTEHPLGRRVDLGDPRLGSVYRIHDNVIYEVNRNAGPTRFTITVLEVMWDEDHKYLPTVFTMNFFDAKTGELKTAAAHVNRWQRLGAFDVPSLILEVSSGHEASPPRQMTLTHYRLAEKKPPVAK